MSILALRRALYGKLAGDTTLAGGGTTNGMLGTAVYPHTHAIYYETAPEGTGFPYVLFNRQSSVPEFAFTAKLIDTDIWLVKAVGHSETADAADAISDRLETLLTDGTISLSGGTALYLRPEASVDYSEVTDGEVYHHAGHNFRVITSPS